MLENFKKMWYCIFGCIRHALSGAVRRPYKLILACKMNERNVRNGTNKKRQDQNQKKHSG